MAIQSYTVNKLLELLSNGKVEEFRYTNFYAITYLDNGAEILFDLNDGKIPFDLMNFAVKVFKNINKCINDAQSWLNDIKYDDKMYSDAFDLGFELYGITFGKIEYGHQPKPATNGLIITFKTINYCPCIFSVKYNENMHPFAIEKYVQ